ncbi:MAG: hypothetical protein IOB84_13685 [Brevundimonas sp.]|nr:hypothetical protein [Brevundimonas sp.]
MKVKTPKEDPAAKSAREREERRADAAFIENTSNLLSEEERRRVRRFGRRQAAVRVAGQAGAAGSGMGSASAGSFDPAGYGGSSGSGGGSAGAGDFSSTVA